MRRRKQLLDDLKEKIDDTGNCERDRALWRGHFVRGCGPVVREKTV